MASIKYSWLADQAATISSLINDWNASLDTVQAMVKQQNDELLSKMKSGLLTAEAVKNGLQQPPKKVDLPSEGWCHHFRNNFGWSLLAHGSAAQAMLGKKTFLFCVHSRPLIWQISPSMAKRSKSTAVL